MEEEEVGPEALIDSEQKIQKMMVQILEGLAFLHDHDLAHLDLKPDNIMFDSAGNIQLIDFGMSRMIPSLQKAGVLVGTPNFVAPEVIDGFYDKKADIWSVGVIFFLLRFGYPPFFEPEGVGGLTTGHSSMAFGKSEAAMAENKRLFDCIRSGFTNQVKEGLGPWFPAEVPISEHLRDLMARMLRMDTAQRPTAKECLDHKYFAMTADSKKLPKTVMEALTKFNGQCHFKVSSSCCARS